MGRSIMYHEEPGVALRIYCMRNQNLKYEEHEEQWQKQQKQRELKELEELE